MVKGKSFFAASQAGPPEQNQTDESLISGYCRQCDRHHQLDSANAKQYAYQLMERLENEKSIDLFRPAHMRDPQLATDYLQGKARGKMFGVLEGINKAGEVSVLYSFSGQYNGIWLVEGWSKPLFDHNNFVKLNGRWEPEVKILSREIAELPPDGPAERIQALRKERQQLSRWLMAEIHALYEIRNFRGDTSTLSQASLNGATNPTGTGDCCAPKLLNSVIRAGLRPLSIAEFYWGKENKSGTRQHGHFYGPCPRCASILGFMLCGHDVP